MAQRKPQRRETDLPFETPIALPTAPGEVSEGQTLDPFIASDGSLLMTSYRAGSDSRLYTASPVLGQ